MNSYSSQIPLDYDTSFFSVCKSASGHHVGLYLQYIVMEGLLASIAFWSSRVPVLKITCILLISWHEDVSPAAHLTIPGIASASTVMIVPQVAHLLSIA